MHLQNSHQHSSVFQKNKSNLETLMENINEQLFLRQYKKYSTKLDVSPSSHSHQTKLNIIVQEFFSDKSKFPLKMPQMDDQQLLDFLELNPDPPAETQNHNPPKKKRRHKDKNKKELSCMPNPSFLAKCIPWDNLYKSHKINIEKRSAKEKQRKNSKGKGYVPFPDQQKKHHLKSSCTSVPRQPNHLSSQSSVKIKRFSVDVRKQSQNQPNWTVEEIVLPNISKNDSIGSSILKDEFSSQRIKHHLESSPELKKPRVSPLRNYLEKYLDVKINQPPSCSHKSPKINQIRKAYRPIEKIKKAQKYFSELPSLPSSDLHSKRFSHISKKNKVNMTQLPPSQEIEIDANASLNIYSHRSLESIKEKNHLHHIVLQNVTQNHSVTPNVFSTNKSQSSVPSQSPPQFSHKYSNRIHYLKQSQNKQHNSMLRLYEENSDQLKNNIKQPIKPKLKVIELDESAKNNLLLLETKINPPEESSQKEIKEDFPSRFQNKFRKYFSEAGTPLSIQNKKFEIPIIKPKTKIIKNNSVSVKPKSEAIKDIEIPIQEEKEKKENCVKKSKRKLAHVTNEMISLGSPQFKSFTYNEKITKLKLPKKQKTLLPQESTCTSGNSSVINLSPVNMSKVFEFPPRKRSGDEQHINKKATTELDISASNYEEDHFHQNHNSNSDYFSLRNSISNKNPKHFRVNQNSKNEPTSTNNKHLQEELCLISKAIKYSNRQNPPKREPILQDQNIMTSLSPLNSDICDKNDFLEITVKKKEKITTPKDTQNENPILDNSENQEIKETSANINLTTTNNQNENQLNSGPKAKKITKIKKEKGKPNQTSPSQYQDEIEACPELNYGNKLKFQF